MKIFGFLIALLFLAGCSPNRGYFRLNQDDGGARTNWAAISQEVGAQVRR